MNELRLEYVAAGDLTLALTQFKAASAHSEVATANATLLASRINSSPETQPSSARYSAHDWYLEARRYHRGEGVPANYTEAVRLYQIAASSGDVEARKMLALIFSRPTQGGLIDTVWMQQLVWCLKSNHQIMVLAARATDAKMVSALLCHTNGLGSSL